MASSFNLEIRKSVLVTLQLAGYDTLFEVSIWLFGLFEFRLDWTRRQDHAGVSFLITILWFHFQISYIDRRHWNYDTDTWEVY